MEEETHDSVLQGAGLGKHVQQLHDHGIHTLEQLRGFDIERLKAETDLKQVAAKKIIMAVKGEYGSGPPATPTPPAQTPPASTSPVLPTPTPNPAPTPTGAEQQQPVVASGGSGTTNNGTLDEEQLHLQQLQQQQAALLVSPSGNHDDGLLPVESHAGGSGGGGELANNMGLLAAPTNHQEQPSTRPGGMQSTGGASFDESNVSSLTDDATSVASSEPAPQTPAQPEDDDGEEEPQRTPGKVRERSDSTPVDPGDWLAIAIAELRDSQAFDHSAILQALGMAGADGAIMDGLTSDLERFAQIARSDAGVRQPLPSPRVGCCCRCSAWGVGVTTCVHALLLHRSSGQSA